MFRFFNISTVHLIRIHNFIQFVSLLVVLLLVSKYCNCSAFDVDFCVVQDDQLVVRLADLLSQRNQDRDRQKRLITYLIGNMVSIQHNAILHTQKQNILQ